MSRIRVAALVLAFAGIAGCHAAAPTTAVDNPAWTTPDEVLAIQTAPMSVQEQMRGQTGVLRLTMTNEGFEPQSLAVRCQETGPCDSIVKIYLRNTDTGSHNFVLPRFHIATSILPPGQETYIEFTAGEKGDWQFFSDAPGSPEPKFLGTLKVE